MKPSSGSLLLESRIAHVEEIAHELSNSVGMTMNYLQTFRIDDSLKSYEHLAVARQEAMRSTGALRTLMGELHLLRLLVMLGLTDQIDEDLKR